MKDKVSWYFKNTDLKNGLHNSTNVCVQVYLDIYVMKVYLDNNILISIEESELDFSILKGSFPNNTIFYYSYAHIQELLEATKGIDNLINTRLNTILTITNNNYLFPYQGKIESKIEEPKRVIATIKKNPFIFESFRHAAKNFNIYRTQIIQELGIDKRQLNNFSTKDAISHINHVLNNKLLKGFKDIIDLAGINLHQRIATIFNFLDVIGYWKDKKNLKSDLARMYDSTHVYFSTECDFFISNDKRARNKAKVAFEIYNIKTQVRSFEELIMK